MVTLLAVVSSGLSRDIRNERRLRKYGPVPPKDKRGSDYHHSGQSYFTPSNAPASHSGGSGYSGGPSSSKGYEALANYAGQSSSSKGYEALGNYGGPPSSSKGYETLGSYSGHGGNSFKFGGGSIGHGSGLNLAALTLGQAYMPASYGSLSSGKTGPVTFGLGTGSQSQAYMSPVYASSAQTVSSLGIQGMQGIHGYSGSQVNLPVISLGSGYSFPGAGSSAQSYSLPVSSHGVTGGLVIASPQGSYSPSSSSVYSTQSSPTPSSSYESPSYQAQSGPSSNYHMGSSSTSGYHVQSTASSPSYHMAPSPSYQVASSGASQSLNHHVGSTGSSSSYQIASSPSSGHTATESSYPSSYSEPSYQSENTYSNPSYTVPSTNYGTPYSHSTPNVIYSPPAGYTSQSSYPPTSYSNSLISYAPSQNSYSSHSNQNSYSSPESSYSPSQSQSQPNAYTREQQSAYSNTNPMYLTYAYKHLRNGKTDPKYDTISYSNSDQLLD